MPASACSRARTPSYLLAALMLLPGALEAARFKIKVKPDLGPRLKAAVEAPRTIRANRRRQTLTRQEATLGANPKRFTDKKKTIENPDHIRNQNKLLKEAQEIARSRGDELVGPAVGYFRTTHGRLIRVTPNKGTGNLRVAAKLKSGERLAALEQVGFATRNGNQLIRVSTGGPTRLAALGRPLTAGGGLILTGTAFFARDLLRMLGLREGSDLIQETVQPTPPSSPQIHVGEDGGIEIDGDGDGDSELQLDRPGQVVVDGDGDGRDTIVLGNGGRVQNPNQAGGDDVLVISPGEDSSTPGYEDLVRSP